MRKLVLIPLFLLVVAFAKGQNKDTANISITNFKLFPGTFSWRSNNTFHDMTSFNSSDYTEGHLRQGTNFRMNYRLLPPRNHDAAYQPGYPLIVMFHGAGERGNCWNDDCYCAGCNPNGTPNPGADPRFLNNDHNLVHGGNPHLSARNLANGRLPEDPTMPSRAFPGFVLFPQMTSQWRNGNNPSVSDVSYAIRIIRLLCKQYNIDQDRIYIHGLSMGGQAALEALNFADWLFAATAPMSAIPFGSLLEYDSVKNIPFWVFQGGVDSNPKPAQTESMIRQLREKGANVRYTLYPTLGHGTWNSAYAEPDFFTWLLSHRKSNIHVDFDNPNICGTTGAGASLVLPQGFLAYQWERDGEIIPGANSHTYVATFPGVYRARFSRISSAPQESQWNRWSDPVSVGEKSPQAPVVEQIGTVVLSDLNRVAAAYLKAPSDAVTYTWFQNGVQIGAPTVTQQSPGTFRINGCTGGGPCDKSGAYTVITEGFDKCPSLPSEPKYVIFGTHNTTLSPPVITLAPTTFTAEVQSPNSVLLKWQDNSKDERHYEIWRRKLLNVTGENFQSGWVLAAFTEEDQTIFLDKGLEPASTYWYKIRGVNNRGRSNYVPGNNTTAAQSRVVITPGETTRPTPPTNLLATTTAVGRVELTWEASSDVSGIRQYYIYYNNDSIATTTNVTRYVISNLPINNVYNFTVKAQDTGGNLSLRSNPSQTHTYVTGLYYKHTTGAWTDLDEPTMVASWSAPEFTGWVPNFTLQPRTQDDFFNFEFEGYLYIQTAGTYTFYVNSDDGGRLFLDGNVIVNWDGVHGLCSGGAGSTTCPNSWGRPSAALTLSAGAHPIRVRYFEGTGGQNLFVRYRGPDVGNTAVVIPTSALRSGTIPAMPVPPAAPANLVATATGMQSIDLAWDASLQNGHSIEIQRSLTSEGSFATINSTTQNSYNDTGLTPNTTYYYRIRTNAPDTVSAFAASANATTLNDNVPPSQPGTPVLFKQGFSTASLTWPASTDNVGIKEYDVYANAIYIGSSTGNSYQATGLTPNSSYTFYVVARDLNNNQSAASGTLNVTTLQGEFFYTTAQGSELNALASWRNQANAAPASFEYNGQFFVVQHALPINNPWKVEGSVSKILVDDNVSITIDNTYPVYGRLEIPGNGTLNINNTTIPQLFNLSDQSTVNYSTKFIQKTNYGNLGLTSPGAYTFPQGSLDIKGNLEAVGGTSLKGASSNGTTLRLYGNLNINGVPAVLASSFGVTLELAGTNQTLQSGGAIDLYQIKKTNSGVATLVNSGTAIPFNVGSTNGGGISLTAGSELNLGNNILNIIGSGTINKDGESGVIGSSGGSISVTTTSGSDSYLFFKSGVNNLAGLTQKLTGSGRIQIQSPVNISDSVKIHSGDLLANGNITLLSTETKTANLHEIAGNGRVLGNMNVQRYVNAKPRVYRYISTPVAGVKVIDWQQAFPITGAFTGSSTGPGLGSSPSMFIWESTGYVPYPTTSNEAPIERGRGYAAFVRNTTPVVISVSGVPHQGTVPFTINQPVEGDDYSGWSLLGNPYASTIQWRSDQLAWPSANMSTIIAVRNNINPTTAQYQYYDASTGIGTTEGGLLEGGRIAPGQAFWAFSATSGATLSVTEKAKSTGQQILYRESADRVSHLRVNLTQNGKSDQTVIMLTNYATNNFDKAFDAIKIGNTGVFNLSSLTDNNVPVAMNNLLNEFCSKTVWLAVDNAAAGTYSLQVESPETLFGVGSITLKDHFTDTSIDLLQQSTYQFSITSDAASYGSARFEIVFDRPSLNLTTQASASIECDAPAKIVLTNTQPGVTYTLMDLAGQVIGSAQESHGANLDFILPANQLVNGTNELQVQASFKGCTSAMLPQHVTFEHYAPVTLEGSDLSICKGTSANLKVTASSDVAEFAWYKDNVRIKGVTSAEFKTDAIDAETLYTVRAITSNGCEGPGALIRVSIIEEEFAELVFNDNMLYTSASGTEYQWFLNDELLHVSKTGMHTPTEPGNYHVRILRGACWTQSTPIFFAPADEEEVSSLIVTLYPNPAPAKNINVRVLSPSNDPVQLTVIDALGRSRITKFLGASELKTVITLESSLTPGLYFLILEQNSQIKKVKFIVKEAE